MRGFWAFGTIAQRWGGLAVGLPRYHKRAILVSIDLVVLSLVLWLGLSLRHGTFYTFDLPERWLETLLVLSGPVMTVSAFGWFGLYRQVTRFIGPRGFTRIVSCVGISVLLWALMVFMAGQHGVPRSVIVFYFFAASIAIVSTRQAMGWVLRSAGLLAPRTPVSARRPVLIYGAGNSGVQLLEALRRGGDREAVAFVDGSASLRGQYVAGLKVHPPQRLVRLIGEHNVREVLVALPEAQRLERREVLKALEDQPVAVRILPDVGDLAAHVALTDLRPLDVVDLLGREPVPPNAQLMATGVQGKSILVTGAGGSVGGELARQLLRQGPRRLVLLDSAEPALYEIEREIAEIQGKSGSTPAVDVVSVLGSVLDPALIPDVLRRYDVRTIYHAAAYKHVPIVEANPIVGIRNNTFGTLVLADAAEKQGVERFILVSTDKAVRPTSVMGASKRLAEFILQAKALETTRTVFAVVRFGNVLDSSGSVVRRFRRQIAAGGPVTITHPQMTRYFMSLREAAELVIQAGAMASGGEVFVLDMGEPIKIDDLARVMIRLSGLRVRSKDNPDGDIEIAYTGLRPGEKIFEELLINPGAMATAHPRIWWLDEPVLPWSVLHRELSSLQHAMSSGYLEAAQSVLGRIVEEYKGAGQGAGLDVPAAGEVQRKVRLVH